MANNLNSQNKIKVIALDFDGVITNLNIDWKLAIRLASKLVGYDIKSLLAFYETSHGTPAFQLINIEIEKLELDALKNAEPTPFIARFLKAISKSNVEIWIVSMQSTLVVKKFLYQHNLTHFFKGVLTREQFRSKKMQISYLLSKSGVNPDEILLIDNSESNINKCRELGIRCFHFSRWQNLDKVKKIWNSILEIV